MLARLSPYMCQGLKGGESGEQEKKRKTHYHGFSHKQPPNIYTPPNNKCEKKYLKEITLTYLENPGSLCSLSQHLPGMLLFILSTRRKAIYNLAIYLYRAMPQNCAKVHKTMSTVSHLTLVLETGKQL